MADFIGDGSDNTLTGGPDADRLDGAGGNDILRGGGGDDILIGGPGVDTMEGNFGDDWYYVDSQLDIVIENNAFDNLDRVLASVNYVLPAGLTIERLTTADSLATTPINLTGNERVNQVYGNAGANLLDGGAGADTMIGLGGDDWFVVDDMFDSISEFAGEGANDRVFASVSYVLNSSAAVETLTTTNHLGTSAIDLTGNIFAQLIYGNAGNNVIDGKGGADGLVGFAGDDTYFVDNAADTVNESVGGGTDRVFASVSYTLTAGSSIELLAPTDNSITTARNFTGNELANAIEGSAGVNILDGKGGADTLTGLSGDDWYYVDNVGDAVVEGVGGGNDRVWASLSYTLGAGVEVEILTTGDNLGTAAINLTGNEFGQYIYGNAGTNVLDGKAGADVLVGLEGDDWYFVDNAAERVLENAGWGTNDRVFASVSYTLGAGVQVEIFTTDDNLATAAINLTGNEFGQYIYGNAGANVLDGKGGADSLTGMAGADTFRFTTALGGGTVDYVSDYNVADDTIQLDDAVFTGLALGTLTAGAFNTGAAATEADDRIVYDAANGALWFDADGLGGTAAVQFATLSTGLALTAADFVVI